MAARATWKGFLQISLVNIPIKVFPATESSGTISFNQLHGECQTRIQQKRWCPQCNREVPNSEIVKGYEFEKGRHVIATFEQPLDLANYRDEYREGLQKIIDAKIAGEEIVSAAAPSAPPKVVNLMDALKKSLDTVSAGKKRPAKAIAAEKPAAQKRKRA